GVSTSNSIAAGTSADAENANVFIWSDGSPTAVSTTNNQVIFYSVNGVMINTNNAGTNALRVRGSVDSSVGFTVNGSQLPYIFGTNGTGVNVTETTNHTLSHWDFNSAQGLDAGTNVIDTWGAGLEAINGHYLPIASGVMTNTRWN